MLWESGSIMQSRRISVGQSETAEKFFPKICNIYPRKDERGECIILFVCLLVRFLTLVNFSDCCDQQSENNKTY